MFQWVRSSYPVRAWFGRTTPVVCKIPHTSEKAPTVRPRSNDRGCTASLPPRHPAPAFYAVSYDLLISIKGRPRMHVIPLQGQTGDGSGSKQPGALSGRGALFSDPSVWRPSCEASKPSGGTVLEKSTGDCGASRGHTRLERLQEQQADLGSEGLGLIERTGSDPVSM